MWQQNLLSNLLTVFILGTLAIIIYCKVKNQTLGDLIKSIKEAMQDE